MRFRTKPARNSDTVLARSRNAANSQRRRPGLLAALLLGAAVAAIAAAPPPARGLGLPAAAMLRPSPLAVAIPPIDLLPQAVQQQLGIDPGGHLGSRGRGGVTDSPRVGDR
jgi:hypothetical protein